MDTKVIFTVRDSIGVRIYKLPVDTIVRTIGSRINKTLYHSILESQTSYELGIKLSEVFAWQVDFFKIDVNDYFKVIFEELRVDGKTYAIGKIASAEFYHRGDTFRAYRFLQDEAHTYFDDAGKSLRKAFLKAPLKYSRISSRYTKKRFHPVQKRWKAHLGTDYAAPHGTPIRTVGDGVVVASSFTYGNGNYVKVQHNSTYTTQYLHMSKRAVRNGQRVTQGQVIGYVGSTGLATGPHLCFRFWMNGKQVDPFSVKIPPSTPISESNRGAFEQVRDSLRREMNSIPLDASNKSEVQ
ncbi:MAG: peptidoglycan DD-metalloendopeptidase family protein [Flavobacteriales bacterium]|nr:peptidoglycan DD-metalloendopeptidase family protein [Flavobacteriales bacterium]